jgi:membrane-associated phospholipid phosphatase
MIKMFARSLKAMLTRFSNNVVDTFPHGHDETTGHEKLYKDLGFLGSFRKGLPTTDGQVSTEHYLALHKSLFTQDFSPLQGIATGLADPLGAYYGEIGGPEASCPTIGRGPPTLDSAEMGRDMDQLYAMVLVRDVPFTEYVTHETVGALSKYFNTVPGLLFRVDPGGPFLSQFLLTRQYPVLLPQDYILTRDTYDRVHSGRADKSAVIFQTENRYISSLRDLASYGYKDYPFQAYLDTVLYLAQYHPTAMINPYAGKPYTGFLAFNVPFALDLISKASVLALKSTWYHKWLVHRQLRPEEMAYEVDRLFSNRAVSYEGQPHLSLLESPLLKIINEQQGNVLLAQAFPEGAPQHPSYPAGHSTIAGACVTILKALYKEDYVLPHPVTASENGTSLTPWTGETLTLGSEFNKLAYNIGCSRCAGGVHYNSDNDAGYMLGEKIALRLLEEVKIKNVDFRVRKFNNQVVTI